MLNLTFSESYIILIYSYIFLYICILFGSSRVKKKKAVKTNLGNNFKPLYTILFIW